MDFDNILTENRNVSGIYDENSKNIDFNEMHWNCVTSKAFLECYLKNFTDEEEKKVGAIHSKPGTNKELNCSPAEYQQSITILRKNNWYEQLCKCSNCLIFYQKHNADFLFGINIIECLPTEILLVIFKKLPPSDRRVASECCKRFLEIWLCDDFIDDRCLVFDKCVLAAEKEPLSNFLKSQRTYRHLVFGDIEMHANSYLGTIFGETVTTLELNNVPEICFEHVNKQLTQFPNLKTLKVDHTHQLGDFSNTPTTLELLVISDYCSNKDKLNIFKSNYLNKTSDSFRVELNFENEPEHVMNFTELQRNKTQGLHIDFAYDDGYRDEEDEDGEPIRHEFKLPCFKNLKYLKLDFNGKSHYFPEDILDNVEEQLPALEDLSITMKWRLPNKNWTCLKTLNVYDMPKRAMSRLKMFENLKELTIETEETCFFTHKAFLNKALKTLDLQYHMIRCAYPCFTCFQTVTKSFPELENFKIDYKTKNSHLRELATYTPKLKCLTIDYVDSTASFESLPKSLRKLKITFKNLNLQNVKIFDQMPTLEDLEISCKEIVDDCALLFQTIAKCLKRLKHFKFFHYGFRMQELDVPSLVDEIATNCTYLRHIEISGVNEDDEFIKQLLQKHASLQSINGTW